jgi:hypothetical protein
VSGQSARWPALGQDVSQEDLLNAVGAHRAMVAQILRSASAIGDLDAVMDEILAEAWASLDRWRDRRDEDHPETWGLVAWVGKIAGDRARKWVRTDVPKRWGDGRVDGAPVRRLVAVDTTDPGLEAVAGLSEAMGSREPGLTPLAAAVAWLREQVLAGPGGVRRWAGIEAQVRRQQGAALREQIAAFAQARAAGAIPPVGRELAEALDAGLPGRLPRHRSGTGGRDRRDGASLDGPADPPGQNGADDG